MNGGPLITSQGIPCSASSSKRPIDGPEGKGAARTWHCRQMVPYRDGLFIGTPKEPEILYAPIIEAFVMTIDDIKAGEV